MTPQRQLVLNILESSETHLDAEGIWERAHNMGEDINLATISRTLSVLKEMDMVDPCYFARDHKRQYFEPTHKAEHYHFTCLECGSVTEFSTSRMKQLQSELEDKESLQLIHTCMCFEGYCSECKTTSTQTEDV